MVRYTGDVGRMTKSRIFLFVLIAFVAGVAVRSFMFVPYAVIWLGGIAAVIIFAIGLSRQGSRAWIAGLFLAAFLIGIFRYDAVERTKPDLSQWYGAAVSAEGVVWEAPRRDGNLQRMKVRVTAIDGAYTEQPFFVLATVRRYPEYRIGDIARLEGVIEEPENFSEGFDYVSYLARQDIFALMSFPQTAKTGEDKQWRLTVALSRVKDAFEANIDSALPEPHAAFLKGLTLGERTSLPAELVEDFQKTGTSHIVALSGYNITMVGRFFTNVLLILTIPFSVSFWIAAAAIILFILLTGASASVVRAGIMGLLVLVAQKEGRQYRMTNALAFAGAAMVFHNPYILRFDAAFQLSFLATVGLIYLSPQIEQLFDRFRSKLSLERRKQDARADRYNLFPLRQTFIETLSAQVMVLPLLIYLFGRVSVVSPITNVLVLIAVPWAMTLGFLAGGLGFLWTGAAVAAGWAVWVFLEYILRLIHIFAAIPLASVELGQWAIVLLAIVYLWVGHRLWKKSRAISMR